MDNKAKWDIILKQFDVIYKYYGTLPRYNDIAPPARRQLNVEAPGAPRIILNYYRAARYSKINLDIEIIEIIITGIQPPIVEEIDGKRKIIMKKREEFSSLTKCSSDKVWRGGRRHASITPRAGLLRYARPQGDGAPPNGENFETRQ